jgi:hypothetical protein
MNEFAGKAIEHAVTHSVMHYPGIGQFGPTMNVKQLASSVKVTNMTMGDSFVAVNVEGPQKQTAIILIPLSNFSHIVMAK